MIHQDLKNANILIVDDQQANIDILVGLLEMNEYVNIKTISDSRLVFDEFKSFNPDLILLDLMMPYFSGYEILEQLNTLIPPTTYLPILVLTADITAEAKQKALSSGAKDFLIKPFDLIEVNLRIENLLETRFLHNELETKNQDLEEKVKERTSELVKTNSDLVLAKEKAEASDRLKTAFLQNISHEIRTPLNGIIGFGSILSDKDLSDDDRRQFSKLLLASSDRLLSTITDYIDMSLIISSTMEVRPKTTDVIKLMSNQLGNFQSTINAKNINFEVSIPIQSNEFTIETDPEMLRKILSHLIDNALKFTMYGSINVGFELKNDTIEFFVKDSGIGIRETVKEIIFQPFMQENMSSTRDYEGSGLGLTIVKNMAELLGGRVWFESEKGMGTSFFVALPITISPEKKEALKKQEKPQLKNLKILITDDDETSNLLISHIIRKISKETLIAKNGQEAVDICRNNPDIDLILMDLRLPIMSGLQATELIRQFNKSVLIIAQTAFSVNEDREKAMRAGCNEFITKPYNETILLTFIRKYFKNTM